MKSATILLMAAAALAIAAGDSGAPRNAADRLREAQNAEQSLCFRATVNTATFGGAGPASSQVIVSRKPGAGRWEYQSPALRGLVVIEKAGNVIRLDPTRKVATVERAHAGPAALDLLLKNHEVTAEKAEDVAGRTADVLAVRHRQTGRLAKKVWVDRERALIVRSESYDSDGKLASLTVHDSIEWNPKLDDSLFEVPAGWQRVGTDDDRERHWQRDALSKEVGFEVREPSHVPAGYTLDGLHLFRCRRGLASAHLRYVDGLNSVSVFEQIGGCPRAGGPGGPGGGKGRGWGRGRGGGGRCGCELVCGRQGEMLVKHSDGMTFILVGDLPKDELQKIADSIR